MEAADAGLPFRVSTLEREEADTKKSIGRLHEGINGHNTDLAVQERAIADNEKDIGDLQRTVTGLTDRLEKKMDLGFERTEAAARLIREESQSEMKWVRRGLWAGAAFFGTATVGLFAVLVTILQSHG